jgi:hypothetical protein
VIVQAQKGEVSARGATYSRGAVLLRGESGKVDEDLAAVRAIAPDATIRTYYLALIATSAESNNVANSGPFTRVWACLTQGLTRLRDLRRQSWAAWPWIWGGESRSPGSRSWAARSPSNRQPSQERRARPGRRL